MNRVERLVNEFVKYNIDGMIISDAYNRRYLSGFTGSSGFLYISQQKRVMITDFRYIEQVKRQCPDFEVIDFAELGLMKTIYKTIKDDGANAVGFEAAEITYERYLSFEEALKDIELVDTVGIVEEIRMLKDEQELLAIKEAARIADEGFKHILTFIKPGVTEKEVALELEFFMRNIGADKLSFDTIVASGVNASLPHAYPTEKKIVKGDFLTMDFGCIYKGYCSDMTRTIIIGKGDTKQKDIYNTVLKAQLEALEALKAGVTGKEIDLIARDIIYGAGFEGMFGHGLGHSVGLFIHEDPRLSPKGGDTVLKENMIVTVEPGIYVPEYGGVRIEDLVCIKENGIENYTSSVKELIEL